MKKLVLSLLVSGMLLLTGCYESTQEITLNADGSGTVSNTNDMSALIGIAKQMGGADKLPDEVIDSTLSMAQGADSIPNLSPEEREMARKGTLKIKMNLKDEKFLTSLSFPFSNPSQITVFNKLSGKIMTETMKDKVGGGGDMPAGTADQMPEASSIDDYYKLEFSNGELTKKLDAAKFAKVGDDQYLSQMKQAGSMGLNMKANYIINLPRPATKAEGKNVKLSEDKKKVTISVDLDDFFDEPSSLEFKIKY